MGPPPLAEFQFTTAGCCNVVHPNNGWFFTDIYNYKIKMACTVHMSAFVRHVRPAAANHKMNKSKKLSNSQSRKACTLQDIQRKSGLVKTLTISRMKIKRVSSQDGRRSEKQNKTNQTKPNSYHLIAVMLISLFVFLKKPIQNCYMWRSSKSLASPISFLFIEEQIAQSAHAQESDDCGS